MNYHLPFYFVQKDTTIIYMIEINNFRKKENK